LNRNFGHSKEEVAVETPVAALVAPADDAPRYMALDHLAALVVLVAADEGVVAGIVVADVKLLEYCYPGARLELCSD
jgi:hypothetical protein